MNAWGMGLPNGPLGGERDRLLALGCDWLLALHPQLDDLIDCCQRSGARGIVRWMGRDTLSQAPDELVAALRPVVERMLAAGIRDLIPWNEVNNPIEGHVYQPAESARRAVNRLKALRAAFPDVILHLPAHSPPLKGFDYLLAEVDAGALELVDVVDAHCYGDAADAIGWLDIVLAAQDSRDVAVTEVNFGAGRDVNPNWYALDAIHLMRGVEDRPRVQAACFFIWRWIHPDSGLITTVDVAGQPIETTIRVAGKRDRAQQQEATMDEQIKYFAKWAGLRIANEEDPRDAVAFCDHLRDIGADYRQPHAYGLPFVAVVSGPKV